VLLSQTYVIDSELTVEKAVEQAEKTAGAPIKITGFHRYSLGEGIEQSEEE
jgi:elongation factor Ts